MKLFLVVLLLSLLCGRFYQYAYFKPHYHEGEQVMFQTALQADPVLSNTGQTFSFKDRYNQTIFVTASSFPRFHNGQVLQMTGNMQVKSYPDGRVRYGLYSPQIRVNAEAENIFAGAAQAVRNYSSNLYAEVFPSQSASLLLGIVFGAKEQFDQEFFASLQATGVLHVIAASGMNVTFVASGLMAVLGLVCKRQLALVFASIGILFYIILVGFQPSIVRAGIMALIAFGANLLGRQYLAAYALVVTAYLMLVWQPGYLFDVGFQLSFMATVGILFCKKLIPLPENFWTETITTTTAAQLTTLPILVGVFGKVGLFALLVNALTLWMIPYLMILGSTAVLIGFALPTIAHVFLLLALPLLLLFEAIVSYFGALHAVAQLPQLAWPASISYYLFLAALTRNVHQKKRQTKSY